MIRNRFSKAANLAAICLFIAAFVSGLFAADLKEIEGSWKGKGRILDSQNKELDAILVAVDVIPFEESHRVYVTMYSICEIVKNVAFNDGKLTFDFGITEIKTIEALVSENGVMRFEYRPTADSDLIQAELTKSAVGVLTDEQVSGLYRGSAILALGDADRKEITYAVSLKLDVKDKDAFAKVVIVTNATGMKYETSFKRIERFGSRLFLFDRTLDEEAARREKIQDPVIKERDLSFLTNCFHVWLSPDKAEIMFNMYPGNGEAVLKKSDETGS